MIKWLFQTACAITAGFALGLGVHRGAVYCQVNPKPDLPALNPLPEVKNDPDPKRNNEIVQPVAPVIPQPIPGWLTLDALKMKDAEKDVGVSGPRIYFSGPVNSGPFVHAVKTHFRLSSIRSDGDVIEIRYEDSGLGHVGAIGVNPADIRVVFVPKDGDPVDVKGKVQVDNFNEVVHFIQGSGTVVVYVKKKRDQ